MKEEDKMHLYEKSDGQIPYDICMCGSPCKRKDCLRQAFDKLREKIFTMSELGQICLDFEEDENAQS